jgi:hypothetical protein
MQSLFSYKQLIDLRRLVLELLELTPSHQIPRYQESVLWHELEVGLWHIQISFNFPPIAQLLQVMRLGRHLRAQQFLVE